MASFAAGYSENNVAIYAAKLKTHLFGLVAKTGRI